MARGANALPPVREPLPASALRQNQH